MYLISIVLLLFFLSGCATTTSDQKPKNVSQSNLTSEVGILVGTFGRDKNGPGYNSKSIKFKNIETGQIYSVDKSMQVNNLYTFLNKTDYSSDDFEGDIFAFNLPFGIYSIYNFELIQNTIALNYGETWTSKQDFDIRFEVIPNKVNYLGNLKFIGQYVKDTLGVHNHKGGYWFLNDRLERDLGYIRLSYPNIPTSDVVSIVPSSKVIDTAFVLFEGEEK